MYVSRGMGAIPAMRPGTRILRLPISRGFGNVRGLGLSCPAGQTPTNRFDGTVACCGGPPESDPCGYLNTQGYIDTQRQAQADAIAGAAGPSGAALLRSIQQYPQNVQQDAIDCVSNPGATFTDAYGMHVTCPSPSMSPVPGINVSIYTPAQIAAMIAGSATPVNPTPIDIAGTTYTPPGSYSPFSAPAPLSTGGGDPLARLPAPRPATSPVPPTAPPIVASAPASISDIGSQITGALSNSVSVGGFNLPIWGIAAALGAFFFLGGKR